MSVREDEKKKTLSFFSFVGVVGVVVATIACDGSPLSPLAAPLFARRSAFL